MPAHDPHALIIGAKRPRLRARMQRLGCASTHAPTLLDGYAEAQRALAPTSPARRMLILLDLQGHEPGFAEFAAPQLAGVLAQAMHAATLHPAWLVGLSTDRVGDAEAYLAGCHLVLHPPLRDAVPLGLVRLGRMFAPLPPTDHTTHAYQRAAVRVFQAVQAAQIPVWSTDDACLLLGVLTPYPLPKALRPRRSSQDARRVLRALGNPHQARQRLHAIAEAWRLGAPLHAEVLGMFLDGWDRRAIVGYFVSRDLYEDSRIYTVIGELPARIAAELPWRTA